MTIRAPWWVFPALFAAGVLAATLWPDAPDAYREALEAELDARARAVQVAETAAAAAIASEASAWEAHDALADRSDSTVAALTARVQTATARAADIGAEIRARVDEATAGLVAELEAEWEGVLESERAQTATWRTRALSAEAGWSDARLAVTALADQVEAMQATDRLEAGMMQALRAEVSRATRDRRVLVVAALAGVAWGLSR